MLWCLALIAVGAAASVEPGTTYSVTLSPARPPMPCPCRRTLSGFTHARDISLAALRVQVRLDQGAMSLSRRSGQILPLGKNAAGRDIAWEDGELAVGMYNATFMTK